MKKIAIVAEHFSPPYDEGFKKATGGIISGLISIGKEVVVFSSGDQEEGFSLPNNRLLIGSRFRSNLRSYNPDLVIYIPGSAATPMSFLRTKLLKWQSAKPVVMISLQRRCYHRVFKKPLRRLLPDLVIVLSEWSRRAIEDVGGRAIRIRLGVDAEKFRPATQQQKSLLRHRYKLPNKKIVLHIGHISQRRNLEILGAIRDPEVCVVMVSSTTTHATSKLRNRLIASGVVLLDNYIESIEEIYQLADAYLFPTYDPMGAIEIPLSVLEAMATDLPVVTTPFGGLPDLFSDVKGLLFVRSADQLPKLVRDALKLRSVETRKAVINLSWQTIARDIANAIEVNLS